MSRERSVSLIRDDEGQILLIPADLELPGAEATIYRDGSRLIIEPKRLSATIHGKQQPKRTSGSLD